MFSFRNRELETQLREEISHLRAEIQQLRGDYKRREEHLMDECEYYRKLAARPVVDEVSGPLMIDDSEPEPTEEETTEEVAEGAIPLDDFARAFRAIHGSDQGDLLGAE